MKTFKQYNESIKDLLQPKSNDEIIKALEGLSDSDKIKQIIINQLDYDLLPENLVVDGDLFCNNKRLTSLPDNLVVNGYLNCSFNELTILPKNLTVNGDLDCRYNKLTSLPENLVVDGYLICYDNLLPKDIKKPKGVTGDFIL